MFFEISLCFQLKRHLAKSLKNSTLQYNFWTQNSVSPQCVIVHWTTYMVHFLLINTLFLSLPFEISPMCNSGKLSFLLYSNDPHFLNLPYILLERNRRKLHFKLIHFPTYFFLLNWKIILYVFVGTVYFSFG